MKKGMVYIEAIVSSLIAMVLVVAVSKLIFTASKILNDTKEKGRAIDIVRGVGSLYKADKIKSVPSDGIKVDDISDVYGYMENKIVPKKDADFTLYTENSYEEGLDMIKIKVLSNKNMLNDIVMVVAK